MRETIMTNILVSVALALGAAVLPARAFAAGIPEKLSDAQLDRVTGGSPAFLPGLLDGPPLMRLPVVPPTILVNPDNPIAVNFSLGATINGRPLPVPALSHPGR
jgi:hypothetical protein